MKKDQEIYLLFKWSIILKGIISFAEILAGVVALFIPASFFTSFADTLTKGELTEEPTSFIANHILSGAQSLTTIGGVFIAFYLISRGAIKLGLVIALLKNKLWAYPWSLFVLSCFVTYQLYEIVKTHSLAVITITVFDVIVMYLIGREKEIRGQSPRFFFNPTILTLLVLERGAKASRSPVYHPGRARGCNAA